MATFQWRDLPHVRRAAGRPPENRLARSKRAFSTPRATCFDHGFEGASIDDIASAARSGKTTIYACFPNKQALFAAAITHRVMAAQRACRFQPAARH